LRTGSPTKFADLQFADQSKEICRLIYLRKFTDLQLRIETKNLQIKKNSCAATFANLPLVSTIPQFSTIISNTSSKPEVENLVALSL
jgi:hypothetical protein